jgi:ABC-type amino acid transport substrate-binding protein
MPDPRFAFTRRQLVRLTAVAGSFSLIGELGAVTAASAAAASTGSAGKPFANGINAASYVGGDGSYGRYMKNGLRLGLIEAYPVNFKDPTTGKRTGWNTDIVLAALDRCGLSKYEFVEGPWESMVPGLQSGRFDLLASDVHVTPARIKVIDFSSPVFWYGDALFVHKGNSANVHSWASLAGKVVGVGLGTNYAEWLQKRNDLKELKAYKDQVEMASDLVAGRVDVVVAEETNFVGFLHKNPSYPIETVTGYVPQSDLSDWTRFGIRQSDKDFNNVFSRAVDEMRIDGTTLRILKSYDLGEHNLDAMVGMTR